MLDKEREIIGEMAEGRDKIVLKRALEELDKELQNDNMQGVQNLINYIRAKLGWIEK